MGPLTIVTVPNISEGRDPARVARVAAALEPLLLDVHSDADHNRSVLTAAGDPSAVEEALVRLAHAAIDEIDVRVHEGAHPRLGSLDVVPLVPLGSESFDPAVEVALHLGRRLSALRLGVYRYDDDLRSLPRVRRAAWDGVPPDLGAFHPTAGSVCLGVRGTLVAFNVDVDPSIGLRRAQAVAQDVRDDPVRALAFALPQQGRLQISMNLVRPDVFGIEAAWQRVRASLASQALGDPIGAELVGLAPRVALDGISDSLAAHTGAREKVLEDRIARSG